MTLSQLPQGLLLYLLSRSRPLLCFIDTRPTEASLSWIWPWLCIQPHHLRNVFSFSRPRKITILNRNHLRTQKQFPVVLPFPCLPGPSPPWSSWIHDYFFAMAIILLIQSSFISLGLSNSPARTAACCFCSIIFTFQCLSEAYPCCNPSILLILVH